MASAGSGQTAAPSTTLHGPLAHLAAKHGFGGHTAEPSTTLQGPKAHLAVMHGLVAGGQTALPSTTLHGPLAQRTTEQASILADLASGKGLAATRVPRRARAKKRMMGGGGLRSCDVDFDGTKWCED